MKRRGDTGRRDGHSRRDKYVSFYSLQPSAINEMILTPPLAPRLWEGYRMPLLGVDSAIPYVVPARTRCQVGETLPTAW